MPIVILAVGACSVKGATPAYSASTRILNPSNLIYWADYVVATNTTNYALSVATNTLNGGWATVIGAQTNNSLILITNSSPTVTPLTLRPVTGQVADQTIFFNADGTTNFMISSNGVVLLQSGTAARPALQFLADNDASATGWSSGGANIWQFNANGSLAWFLSSATLQCFTAGANIITTADGSFRIGSTTIAVSDSGGVWAQRNGAVPQTNRIWGAFTNAVQGWWLESGYDAVQDRHFLRTMSIGSNTNRELALTVGTNANSGIIIKTNGVAIGPSGTTITNILTGSAALTFAAVSAQTSQDQPITVTGTTTNDVVTLGVPFQVMGSGNINSCFTAFTSNNTVWVRYNNYSSVTRATNGVFKVMVTRF